MSITTTPRWSLGRGKTVVPSSWQATEEVAGPFAAAVKDIPGVPGAVPSSFGGECDLLALDTKGRLLAVEVKPRGTSTIVWSGAQATVYARLIERWVRTPPQGTDQPLTILRAMVEQRALLGLAPPRRAGLPENLPVVPVVALQRGAHPKYVQRLQTVQEALLTRGVGDPALEVYEVSMAGRMDRLF